MGRRRPRYAVRDLTDQVVTVSITAASEPAALHGLAELLAQNGGTLLSINVLSATVDDDLDTWQAIVTATIEP